MIVQRNIARIWCLLGLGGCLLIVASLKLGALTIPWPSLWAGLHNQGEHAFTVFDYRLPRTLLAILVGMMLATAGTLVQGVIRNPLASPDILGMSHGAGLGAVCMMIFLPNLSLVWLPGCALLGGAGAAVILALFTRQRSAPMQLAITGIALSAFYAGLIDLLLLVHPIDMNNALLWLTGSLWGRSWSQLAMLWPWCALFPIALMLAHRLDLLGLGEARATTLGISVKQSRRLALGIAVLWTATSVSICGPISFLGLVAPHLARQLVGGRHHLLLPTAMMVGASLLLFADTAARVIAPPIELPAGILTAAIGAPYFLYLLLKMR